MQMLRQHREQVRTSFAIPGHGGGSSADPAVRRFLGAAAFKADVTQTAAIEDLLAPGPVFRALQQQAARLYGADAAWLLTGGSSAAIHAMLLTAVRPGERIVMPRNCHLSALWGLILGGGQPVFLPPRWNATLETVDPPTPQDVENAIAGAVAVKLVSPTYFGRMADVAGIAEVARRHGAALLVDAAWGAHHPAFPTRAGADLVACSVHKMLGGLSGTALLLQKGERVPRRRVTTVLGAVQTTSPYYGALVSIEGAIGDVQGRYEKTAARAAAFRRQLAALPGVEVVPPAEDAARLVLGVAALSGYELERQLLASGIAVEMATARHVVLVLGPHHGPTAVRHLVTALKAVEPGAAPPRVVHEWPVPRPLMSPREAWFAARQTVRLSQAEGRIAAEPLSVYPPGIPLMMPGEEITGAALERLQEARRHGARVQGLTDEEMEVVAET